MAKVKYEKEIDLRMMVDFDLLERRVGAYLLEINGKYALRFGFNTPGIPHYIPLEKQKAAIKNISEGIRSFSTMPGIETLRVIQRSQEYCTEKIKELDEKCCQLNNKYLQLLTLAELQQVEELSVQKQRLKYTSEIYCSYGNEFDFDANILELGLRKGNQIYRYIKGSYKEEFESVFKEFLLEGFERFLEWERLLERRFNLEVSPLRWEELWQRAGKEFNINPISLKTHRLKVTEKDGELNLEDISTKLSARSILIKGEKTASIPIASYDYIKIKNQYVGAVVVENKIEGYGVLSDKSNENQFNFIWNILRTTPNCEIVTEIFKRNTRLDKLNLSRTIKGAKGLKELSRKHGYEGTDSEEELEDAKAARKELVENRRTFDVSLVFFLYRKDTKELKKDCAELSSKLPLGLAVREDADVHELWRNKHPFNWRPLLGFFRRQKYIDKEIPLPFVSAPSREGRRGIEFYDAASNAPVLINYIDGLNNSLIVAQKRKGKTALALEKVIVDLIYDTPVMFLDYGMVDGRTTCSDLVDCLGKDTAANIEIGLSQCNIFHLPAVKKLSRQNRVQREILYQKSLSKFLEQVVIEASRKSDIDGDLIKFLSLGVEKFFEHPTTKKRYQLKDEPIGLDLVNFLEKIEDNLDFSPDPEIVNRVIYKLRVFFNTRFGKSLSNREGLDYDVPFLNFSLRGANNDFERNIAAIATQIIGNARALIYEHTRVILDEGSIMLQKNQTLTDTIAEYTINGGKSGTSVDILTQDVQAIANCQAAEQLKENLDIKLIGAISSSNQEAVANFLNVDPLLLARNVTKDFDPNPRTLESHWMMFSNDDPIELVLRLNPHFLATIASYRPEQRARQRYLQAYSNPIDAMLHFGKDYKKAKLNDIPFENLQPTFAQPILEKV